MLPCVWCSPSQTFVLEEKFYEGNNTPFWSGLLNDGLFESFQMTVKKTPLQRLRWVQRANTNEFVGWFRDLQIPFWSPGKLFFPQTYAGWGTWPEWTCIQPFMEDYNKAPWDRMVFSTEEEVNAAIEKNHPMSIILPGGDESIRPATWAERSTASYARRWGVNTIGIDGWGEVEVRHRGPGHKVHLLTGAP